MDLGNAQIILRSKYFQILLLKFLFSFFLTVVEYSWMPFDEKVEVVRKSINFFWIVFNDLNVN